MLYANGSRRLVAAGKLRKICNRPEVRERKGIIAAQLLLKGWDTLLEVQIQATAHEEFSLVLRLFHPNDSQFVHQWPWTEVNNPDLELQIARKAKETFKIIEERSKSSIKKLILLYIRVNHSEIQLLGTSEVIIHPLPLRSESVNRLNRPENPSNFTEKPTKRRLTLRKISPLRSEMQKNAVSSYRRMVDQEIQASIDPLRRRAEGIARLQLQFNNAIMRRNPVKRRLAAYSLSDIPLLP